MRIFGAMFDAMFAGRKPSLSDPALLAAQDRHAAAGLHSAAGATPIGATTIAPPAVPQTSDRRPSRRRRQPRRVVEPKPRIETAPDDVGTCPRNADHQRPRVYRIHGGDAFCVCDDCGESWSIPADQVETLAVFAARLADSLDAAQRIPSPDRRGGDGVFIDDRTATAIAEQLRRLADAGR